jgi:hypothetical protein
MDGAAPLASTLLWGHPAIRSGRIARPKLRIPSGGLAVNRFRPAVSLVAALVLSGVVSGCGSDAAPTAATPTFDSAPPAAPDEVMWSSDAGITTVSWNPSAAPDVAGYQVFLYAPSPERESAWLLIAELPSTVTDYALSPVSGHATQYYRVRAVDGSGDHSAMSNRVEVVREPVDPETGSPMGPGETPAREE